MTTRIEQITVRDLLAAARRFGEVPETTTQLRPHDVRGYAAVIDSTASRGKGEVVDGMHRTAELAAYAADNDAWDATVTVVVTDDRDLVVAIFDRKDEGHDDVSDLIEAALA